MKTFAPNIFSYGTNQYRRCSEDLQICLQAWKHSGLSQQGYTATVVELSGKQRITLRIPGLQCAARRCGQGVKKL